MRTVDPSNSPRRHIPPAHRSLERAEAGNWCYIDELALLVAGIRGETRIPPSPLMS
jgi:hypothetical protein